MWLDLVVSLVISYLEFILFVDARAGVAGVMDTTHIALSSAWPTNLIRTRNTMPSSIMVAQQGPIGGWASAYRLRRLYEELSSNGL